MDMESKLDMTPDEQRRIKEAFKNEEFRKLFFDYMNEISDPKNKALYEQEIAMLEAEKGNDVRFIKPVPSHVIKTVDESSKQKVFVNMCWSNEIAPASRDPKPVIKDGKPSQGWHIPYNLTRPREDVDHARKPCTVYDCVFHEDTVKLALQNQRIADMIAQTAIEGIETQFKVKLSRAYKQIKMKSKGTPAMSMVRSPKPEFKKPSKETSLQFIERLQKEKPTSTPPSTKPTTTPKQPMIEEISSQLSPLTGSVDVREPVYTIVHQDVHGDYQKYTSERDKSTGARPDRIKIQIMLPGISSASETELEVSALSLDLKVPNKYQLHLELPFPVFSDKGSAKFDKSKSVLTVTVPVVPAPKPVCIEPIADPDPELEPESEEPQELSTKEREDQSNIANEPTSEIKPDQTIQSDIPTDTQTTNQTSSIESLPNPVAIDQPKNVTETIASAAEPPASPTIEVLPDPSPKPDHTKSPSVDVETPTQPISNESKTSTQPVVTESSKPIEFKSKILFDLD